jgi:maltose O-acetyltransferase
VTVGRFKHVIERLRAIRSPREALEIAEATVGLARARVIFRKCECGSMVRALGGVRVMADGRIRLGDGVFFLPGMLDSELTCEAGAELLVGAESGFNYGCSIVAARSITIGRSCLFGSMSRISDRLGERVAPVVLGNEVWLGHGAIVLPGVTIGDRSVVSAGSVVCEDVPPNSLAIGNPARAISLDVRRGKSL